MGIKFHTGTHFYLIGIAGTGMSALATMLLDAGMGVEGSDEDFAPPTGSLLNSLPITLHRGYAAENLDSRPHLVVVGNTATKDHPEVTRARELKIPLWSMPDLVTALGHHRSRIVVAGTHGKSTTTAVIAWLLKEAGLDPGWMIGAVPRFGHPGRYGSGPMVIEGDEYSTAFFDHNPKFLHYHPHHLVLTVVEYDHADIYPDLPAIEREFFRLIRSLPPGGTLLLSRETLRFRSFAPPGVQCLTLPDLGFQFLSSGQDGVEFLLSGVRYRFPFPGEQMAEDAALAIAMTQVLVPHARSLPEHLKEYPGLLRRQEVLRDGETTILWDFGHHPTEVARTLEGIRTAHPGVPLFVVFEPRSYTSRTARFQELYERAFQSAHRLYLAPVFRPERLKESPLDTNALARAHREGKAFQDFATLKETLLHDLYRTPPPWVLVFFSNGTLGGVPQALLEELAL